ncbi:MAG: hypothetical protein ABIG63_07415 [Chloroflexota bacterium]
MAIKFAGAFKRGSEYTDAWRFAGLTATALSTANQPKEGVVHASHADDETVPRLEPGYNPQGEWVQQLKLFALAAGDGRLPVWFDVLNGGDGDTSIYVPQFEAYFTHAQLATHLPLSQVIVLGDRKMPWVIERCLRKRTNWLGCDLAWATLGH